MTATPLRLKSLLDNASIEVMPRTAEGVDLAAQLSPGTQVFVAHIDGTAPEAMARTVASIAGQGLVPVPHIPARIVPDAAALRGWLQQYRKAGARRFLLLGGGIGSPRGPYHESLALLQTGLFDDAERLYIAGHPEGSRDIDPEGGDARVIEATLAKQDYARSHGLDMALVTQFCFEAAPVRAWQDRLVAAGVTLPIRLGIAGPARLQTMIKFAIACGVGPSLRVLQRRARDVTKLLTPFTPDALVGDLGQHIADHPPIEALHLFPLGGIANATAWLAQMHATVQDRNASQSKGPS